MLLNFSFEIMKIIKMEKIVKKVEHLPKNGKIKRKIEDILCDHLTCNFSSCRVWVFPKTYSSSRFFCSFFSCFRLKLKDEESQDYRTAWARHDRGEALCYCFLYVLRTCVRLQIFHNDYGKSLELQELQAKDACLICH